MNDYRPLTPQELEHGYFLLSHKDTFKRLAIIIAVALTALIYGVAIFNLIRLLQAPSFNSLAQSISKNTFDWTAYHQKLAPVPISISTPQSVNLGNRRYDLVAFVNNPNNAWAVPEFQYSFVVNGEELPPQSSFLNPGEDRVILKTGQISANTIASLKVKTGSIKWRRYNNDTPIVNWDISNIKYQPVTRQTVDKKSFVIPPRVTWDAQNLSLHDFWQVDWQVVLLSGDKIVGVKEYQTANFNSLQSRSMEVVWLGDLPRVTKTLVYPALNWLASDNFKTVGQ